MDAIRSYIDQMFRSLPRTAEVRRAHAELVQMSEDRYRELRAGGASDNEAVGRVITQFGNLDELADDLGIRREVDSLGDADAIELSDDDAERFLANRRTGARFIAGGIVVVPTGLAAFLLASEVLAPDSVGGTAVGLAVFFLAIAVAVGLFITGGVSMSRFDRLEGRELRLDPATTARITELRDRETTRFIIALVAGVGAIILGAALVAIGGSIWAGDSREQLATVVGLLVLVGIGAAVLAAAGIRRGALDRLVEPLEGADQASQRSLVGAIAGPYWIFAVVVFLAWSFIGGAWHLSWVVWPIAAVLFAFIAATIGSVEAYRARK